MQAGVVAAAFQYGVGGRASQRRLGGVEQCGDVTLDELMLQVKVAVATTTRPLCSKAGTK
jgi:hypothetical protein